MTITTPKAMAATSVILKLDGLALMQDVPRIAVTKSSTASKNVMMEINRQVMGAITAGSSMALSALPERVAK